MTRQEMLAECERLQQETESLIGLVVLRLSMGLGSQRTPVMPIAVNIAEAIMRQRADGSAEGFPWGHECACRGSITNEAPSVHTGTHCVGPSSSDDTARPA